MVFAALEICGLPGIVGCINSSQKVATCRLVCMRCTSVVSIYSCVAANGIKPCPNCWLRPRANLKRQRRTQHKMMMRILSKDYS